MTPNAALPWPVRARSPGRSCCGSCNRRTAPLPRCRERAAWRPTGTAFWCVSPSPRPGVPAGKRPLPCPGPGNRCRRRPATSSICWPRPGFPRWSSARDGGPATLTAPDPWAFALNKLWWSQQEDRDPARRGRDRSQALAVAGLVLRYLPQLRRGKAGRRSDR